MSFVKSQKQYNRQIFYLRPTFKKFYVGLIAVKLARPRLVSRLKRAKKKQTKADQNKGNNKQKYKYDTIIMQCNQN